MKSGMPATLGRYQIVRELGQGAMGVVYEGLDPVIGRRVAIKTLRNDVLESSGMAAELLERFLREARAAGAINHPNVITVYDAGQEQGVAYIAMEYVESGTLFETINSSRLAVEDAVRICATVCRALAAAHEKGIVHRDVKPANIMMLGDGSIKVADFGIARVSDSSLTQEGVMVGTPQYMSPEQFMGTKVDGRSDLFSAAVIMYEMLTGERPFPAQGVGAIMHQVISVTPVEPKKLNCAVCEELSAVVMKALSKNPNKRYQDGKAMAAALLEALKDCPDPEVLGLVKKPAQAARVAAGLADAPTVLAGPVPVSEAATVIERKAPRRALLLPLAAVGAVVLGLILLLSGIGKDAVSQNGDLIDSVRLNVLLEDGEGGYVDNGTASVVVTDVRTGNELASEAGFDAGVVELSRPSSDVRLACSSAGYEPHTRDLKKADVQGPIDVVLKKVSH